MTQYEHFTYYLYAYFVVKYYSEHSNTQQKSSEALQALEVFVRQLVKTMHQQAAACDQDAYQRKYQPRKTWEDVQLRLDHNHPEQIQVLYHVEVALQEQHFWELFVLAMHDTCVLQAIYRTPTTDGQAALGRLNKQGRKYRELLQQNRHYLIGHSELVSIQLNRPLVQGEASEQWAREFYQAIITPPYYKPPHAKPPHDPLRSEQPYAHLFFLNHKYPWLCFYPQDQNSLVNRFLGKIFIELMLCHHKIASQSYCWQADLRPRQQSYRQQIQHAQQDFTQLIQAQERLKRLEDEPRLRAQSKMRALNKSLIEFSNLYLQCADLVHTMHQIALTVQTNVDSFRRLLDYHELQLAYDQIFTVISKDLDKRQRYLELNLHVEQLTLERLQTMLQTFQARMQNARSEINARTNLLIEVFGILIAIIALLVGLLEVVANLPAGQQWLQRIIFGG